MKEREKRELEAKIMLRSMRNAEKVLFISIYKRRINEQFLRYANELIEDYKTDNDSPFGYKGLKQYRYFQFVDFVFRDRLKGFEEIDQDMEKQETFEYYKGVVDELDN